MDQLILKPITTLKAILFVELEITTAATIRWTIGLFLFASSAINSCIVRIFIRLLVPKCATFIYQWLFWMQGFIIYHVYEQSHFFVEFFILIGNNHLYLSLSTKSHGISFKLLCSLGKTFPRFETWLFYKELVFVRECLPASMSVLLRASLLHAVPYTRLVLACFDAWSGT